MPRRVKIEVTNGYTVKAVHEGGVEHTWCPTKKIAVELFERLRDGFPRELGRVYLRLSVVQCGRLGRWVRRTIWRQDAYKPWRRT